MKSMSDGQPISRAVEIANLSRRPYGTSVARQVALALKEGRELRDQHRDYCGHGFVFRDGRFQLVEFGDGYAIHKPIAEWATEKEFVAFLAQQSDYGCSGGDPSAPIFHEDDPWLLNNQRITEARLQKFVAGADPC